MSTRPPLAEHLTENSIPVPFSGCWIWLLSLNPDGYGQSSVRGRSINTHRLSWIAFRGPIPPGMHVLHSCDIRCCINPDHLWLGTNADNIRDCFAKGRNHPPKQSHVIGATYIASKRVWQAQIRINGKGKYLGVFKRQEDATAAYRAALQNNQAA